MPPVKNPTALVMSCSVVFHASRSSSLLSPPGNAPSENDPRDHPVSVHRQHVTHAGGNKFVHYRIHRGWRREGIIRQAQAQHRPTILRDAAIQIVAETIGLIAVGFCQSTPVLHQGSGFTTAKP